MLILFTMENNMKANYPLEFAKLLGFFGLGYFGFMYFRSAIYAIPLAMLGSAIVSVIYTSLEKEN